MLAAGFDFAVLSAELSTVASRNDIARRRATRSVDEHTTTKLGPTDVHAIDTAAVTMTSLFRASNELGLAGGDLTEVSFNVSFVELVVNGWSWQDLYHFSAHRLLIFQDGSIVMHTETMTDLIHASIQVRGLFCFNWTQIESDFPRELMFCIQNEVVVTRGNHEIAETFSGLMTMFSRSPLPINLTVRCLINDSTASHLPLFAMDELFQRPHQDGHVPALNLRKVAFHNMTFEGRSYRNLAAYFQGIDQLDLDSVILDDDDWADFVVHVRQFASLRILRLLHSHRPSRRQSAEVTRQRLESLFELVTGSRIEVLSICRQHRDKKLYPKIQRQLHLNLVRRWQDRGRALAETYQVDGYTPPLTLAFACVTHNVDLTWAMVSTNARALSYCTPTSLAEERAALEADRQELESLLARVFQQNDVSRGDSDADEANGEGDRIVAPQSSLASKELFYSIARDILGDD